MSRGNLDSRTYGVITYPDNEELNEKLRTYNYACCFHHSDVWSEQDEKQIPDHKEGQPKMPHIHWVLRFENTRSIKRLADELGLPLGRIESLHSLRGSIRYLIHIDNPEKFQYDKNEIEHTFPIDSFFKEMIEEDDAFSMLFSYAISSNNVDWISLTQFAMENNCIKILRRYSYHFSCILKDLGKYRHN